MRETRDLVRNTHTLVKEKIMKREQAIGPNKRQALGISVAALLTTGVSGCADLVISDADLKRISGSVENAVTLSLCDSGPAPAATNKTIDIEFTEKSPGVWCPVGQVETCPQVFQSKQVQWRSVRRDSSGAWEPFSTRFTVYLTPFAGDAFPAPNGKTGLKNLNSDAPEGVYKYTVWDWPNGGDDHACEPLDPNFRVHK
jgi:hypothetical protein